MSTFNDIIWRSEDNERERTGMNGNAMLTPCLCLYLQKESQQDVGHSSDLDQKRSDILLVLTGHKENGTESLNQ